MKRVIKKTDEEFAILQEFWKILQNFYEPEDTDEYWSKLLDTTIKFERDHPNNLLCEQLILMILNYLETKFKKDRTSSYAKLLTIVRWAYKDFVAVANEEDKKILNEVLDSNEGATEQKIILKARQLHQQDSMEQLSMFLKG